jgi:uncharacterized protein (DUF362 family)
VAKRDSEKLSRRNFLGFGVGAAVVAGIGCGNEGDGGSSGVGGTTGVGGATGNGGATESGGVTGNGGSSIGAGGSTAKGNTTGNGGSSPGTGGSTGKGDTTGNGGSSPTTGGTTGKGGTTGSGGTSPNTGGTTAKGGTTGSSTGTGATPLVGMVRNTDVIAATMAAIDAVGGFPDLTGKVVMLRPNMIDTVSGSTGSAPVPANPGSVNPDVIRGVIRAIKAKGTPKSILVAEWAFTGALTNSGGTGVADRNGIAAAVKAEGATLLDIKSSPSPKTVSPAGATNWPSGIPMYQAVLDAEYIVNIPVCKTHGSANFSMALKGWYGCQDNHSHPSASGTETAKVRLCNLMPEIHLAKKEDFVVLDATKCLLTGGPQVGSGKTAAPGIVVASKDAIAVDVTGVCILKHYMATTSTANTNITGSSVWEQPQIARAMQLTALGWLTSKQNFPYSATGIDEAATIMAYRA